MSDTQIWVDFDHFPEPKIMYGEMPEPYMVYVRRDSVDKIVDIVAFEQMQLAVTNMWKATSQLMMMVVGESALTKPSIEKACKDALAAKLMYDLQKEKFSEQI